MHAVTKDLHWWRGRSTLGRCLALLSIFACTAATNQMCHECKRTASSVLSKMKSEIHPCDDFYKFACGSYIEQNKISEDSVHSATFTVLAEKVQEQLKDLLTEERPKTEPKYMNLAHQFYKACMNTTLIEALDDKPMKRISDSLGGWPLIVGESWDSDRTWTWQETVKKLRRLGFDWDIIITVSIDFDLKNQTKHIISLDQFTTTRDVDTYSWKELNRRFYRNSVDVAVLFGADRGVAERELGDAFQFEKSLAEISWPPKRRQNLNDMYNLRTIKQLQESYPYVQWLDYINGILPSGINVDENEVINLKVPSYFSDLGNLLARTDKRVIANYIMKHVHMQSLNYLSKKFQKDVLQPRWKKCVYDVANQYGVLLTPLYIAKYLKQDSKTVALDMVSNIRNAFRKTLDKVEWMDEKTKKEAKRKLHAMENKIAYSDEMLDNNYLEDIYGNIEIEQDKYFEAFFKKIAYADDDKFKRLRLPYELEGWLSYINPITADAFYVDKYNDIRISAGALQGNFFNVQRPMYMNYGAIGFLIGHQITRGFDNQGRHFDSKGDFRDLWTADTEKKFLEKSECIVEQYNNYVNNTLEHAGTLTKDANIADNGGIKLAYLAYKQWKSVNDKEPMLPGMNYTSNQMFWISAAQSLCDKFEKDPSKAHTAVETTFSNDIRILNSLRNSKDFSHDFQCPIDSPMNPQRKCEVW